MSEEKRSKLIRTIVVLVILAVLILGLFIFLVKRGPRDNTAREGDTLTPVQQITTLDLDKKYPPTPREVVELYAKIMQVMYRQTYTDEEFSAMASKLAQIFDVELLNNQINWPMSVKKDVEEKKAGDYSIVNYSVESAHETKIGTVDGYEIANLRCIFALRHGTSTEPQAYLFYLRKSGDDRWRILGWEEIDADD